MKLKIIKIAALCTALSLTLCAASCSGDKSNLSNGTAVSQSDSVIYGVDDGTAFPRGVWAVDDGERRTGYYIFIAKNSGSYIDAEYGMGVAFDVEVDGKSANFHMGAADVNDYAEILISDTNKRRLTWKYDGRTEFLTLMTSEDPDSFEFYSTSDLLNAAYTYYEGLNGTHPEFFSTMVDVDGMVDIQLYDKVDGHNSTAAFYQVDSLTGKGKEVNSGEAVDFSEQCTYISVDE